MATNDKIECCGIFIENKQDCCTLTPLVILFTNLTLRRSLCTLCHWKKTTTKAETKPRSDKIFKPSEKDGACGPALKLLIYSEVTHKKRPGHIAHSVARLTHEPEVIGSIPGLATYFRFSFH